jgi:hypothetical protein
MTFGYQYLKNKNSYFHLHALKLKLSFNGYIK